MASRLIDNKRISLSEVLNDLAPQFDELSIATGYWDLQGMALLIDKLSRYQKIRLLIGQEPLPPRFANSLSFHEPETSFPDEEIAGGLNALDFAPEFQELVRDIKQMLSEGRLQVRVFRGSFLHAKTYIFGGYQTGKAVGIIGSSNFTKAGLTSNLELNALEEDDRIVKFQPLSLSDTHGHLSWFDEIWDSPQTEDWDGRFTALLESSPVGDIAFSPYLMYIKTLYELFGDELVPDSELSGELDDVLFEFQRRNARLLLAKLEKHGLAMLADSVGLGKTITAGAVIKHYLEEKGARRVYVIAPASLTFQWREDLAKVHQLFGGFEIISMQDVSRIKRERQIDKYAGVDLFIIDEAHNLRSGSGTRHDEILDWFSENQESHVLLLTATPINNSLADFVNQIQLAAKGKLESFPVVFPTSKKTEVIDFYQAVGRLTKEITEAEKKGQRPDYSKINRVMQQGLRRFLVRTTRKGIEKEFGGVSDKSGVTRKFPDAIVMPAPYSFDASLTEAIDFTLRKRADVFGGWDPTKISISWLLGQTQRAQHPLDFLSQDSVSESDEHANAFDRIFQVLLLLGFTPYKTDIYQHRFYAKTSEEIRSFKLTPEESMRVNSQLSVHNMLRVNFLKRLESSHFSLRKSLENYLSKLLEFSSYVERGFLPRLRDLDDLRAVYGDDLDGLAPDVDAAIDLDSVEPVSLDPTVHNVEALNRDLQKDVAIVEVLLELCDVLGAKDDKLRAFVDLMKRITLEAERPPKILVFSYFADTVEYLKQSLPELLGGASFLDKSAFTSGHNKNQIEDLARRFSPKSKGFSDIRPSDELQYLFSTDVLSEGQNLQDCGILVNFDLHWNPVRMIQRNGRINRLGSEHQEVVIHNMHPEVNLDEYLALVARLERKIDRIRFTVGTDQSVLGEESNPIEFIDDREQTQNANAMVRLYDSGQATAAFNELGDEEDLLSEDEFLLDLRAFERTATDEQKENLKLIPKGKWGYLPDHSQGVIGEVRALALIRITGHDLGSAEKFVNHIFVSTTESWGPIETIQALRALRVPSSAVGQRADRIALDRGLVAKRSIQVAKSHVKDNGSPVRVTPSITRALDEINRTAPEIDFYSSLLRVATKSELKKAKQLIETINKDLKQAGVVLEPSLSAVREFCERMAKAQTPAREVSTSGAEAVLFYAG